jgi:DNA-binding Lrp family transcriptional regulator
MLAELNEGTIGILDLIQQSIPLVPRPFEAIGEKLGMSEEQVIDEITRLKSKPTSLIRQISAIFDSRSLGYKSSLVAAKVDSAQIEQAAAIINKHPGVSHNYRRNHDYNLWYTVAVPPDSKLGLDKTVQILHQQSGAKVTRLMPALRMFKIGVKFDLGGSNDIAARDEQIQVQKEKTALPITPRDKAMIRVLQQDLPIIAKPFDQWAQQADVPRHTLLDAAQKYIDAGYMRRFSAVLKHRAAGFGANAMGAWIVPAERQEEFGAMAATFSAVSHCYLRPTYPDWPYSVFTMVHAKSPKECEKALAEMSRQTGVAEFAALYSSVEYKKIRVKYFIGDIEAWEDTVLKHF